MIGFCMQWTIILCDLSMCFDQQILYDQTSVDPVRVGIQVALSHLVPAAHFMPVTQDQASIPRPMEVETPLEKPVSTVGYGHGSGILGALTSNALASKPLGSNMQRLGSKMSIPSAIDSSGLVDIAAIRQRPSKPASSPSGALWTPCLWTPCLLA